MPYQMEDVWTFWREEQSQDASTSNLEVVAKVATAEEFWETFNLDEQVSIGQLRAGQSVQIFRNGVKPIMDDPQNQQGGHFSIIVREGSVRKRAEMWLALVTELILNTNTEKVPFVREVNGIGLSLCESTNIAQKGTYTEVKVWLRGGYGARNNAESRKERKLKLQELVKTPTTWCDHKGQQQHVKHNISDPEEAKHIGIASPPHHSRAFSSGDFSNSGKTHERQQPSNVSLTTIVVGASASSPPAQSHANPTHVQTLSNGSIYSNDAPGSYQGHQQQPSRSSADFDAMYGRQMMPPGYAPPMMQQAPLQQPQQPHYPYQQQPMHGRHAKSNTYAGLSPADVCGPPAPGFPQHLQHGYPQQPAQPQQPQPQQPLPQFQQPYAPQQQIPGELRQGFQQRAAAQRNPQDARSRRMKAMSLSSMPLPGGAQLASLNGVPPQPGMAPAYQQQPFVNHQRCFTPENMTTPIQSCAPTPVTQGSVGYSSSGTLGGSVSQKKDGLRQVPDADDDYAKSEASDDTCIDNDLEEGFEDRPQAMVGNTTTTTTTTNKEEVMNWADDIPEEAPVSQHRRQSKRQQAAAMPPPGYVTSPLTQQHNQHRGAQPTAYPQSPAEVTSPYTAQQQQQQHPSPAYPSSPYDMRDPSEYEPTYEGDYYQ